MRGARAGRRFDSSFATMASPLCRFPFRLHRLLNLQNSGWRNATRGFDVLLLALPVWAFLTFVSVGSTSLDWLSCLDGLNVAHDIADTLLHYRVMEFIQRLK